MSRASQTGKQAVEADDSERNETRRAIRSLFRHRQCFTMVRPALQEEDLRRAGELGDEALRPEFLQEMKKLSALISSEIPRKSLLGTELDGGQLAHLASRYLGAINGGAVPEITGAWQSVVAETYREALAAAIEKHKASSRSEGRVGVEMVTVLREIMERSATAFNKICVSGSARPGGRDKLFERPAGVRKQRRANVNALRQV